MGGMLGEEEGSSRGGVRTSRDWKIARVATGSVAEMRAPKVRESRRVRGYDISICPAKYAPIPTIKVEMRVPGTAKRRMEPRLLKKSP